jgi:hypothetical protein
VTSGVVFGSGSALLWSVQQTPVTAPGTPKNYVPRYVGLRLLGGAVGSSTHRLVGALRWPNMLAVGVVGRGAVFGQVALAVAADDASSGLARLSKAPMAEPACAVSASAGRLIGHRRQRVTAER